MARVRVIVEGQTEESFVGGPLYMSLVPYGVFLQPILLGVPGHRGGNVNYHRVKKDILNSLKQDRSAYCSTLFDFYGIGDGFPSVDGAMASTASKVASIEAAMLQEIIQEIPEYRPEVRFIPYIQIHEFEGLLFSDPKILASSMFRADLSSDLQKIRDLFNSPEDINDGATSAPSKRILNLNRGYNKVISGALAAEQMGIDTIKKQCPRFRVWFDKLTSLGAKQP